MYLEEPVELHWRAAAHQLPSTEYQDIIGDQRDDSLRERRHGCASGRESEVLRFVALDELEAALENRP